MDPKLIISFFMGCCIFFKQHVHCAVQDTRFSQDTTLANVVFENDILFDWTSSVRSKARCAVLCGEMVTCWFFTFVPGSGGGGSCRGHSSFFPSGSLGVNGAKTYKKAYRPEGVCAEENHIIIDDVRRDVNNGRDNLCDNTLAPAWYRFKLNGNSAVIPTECVPCAGRVLSWCDSAITSNVSNITCYAYKTRLCQKMFVTVSANQQQYYSYYEIRIALLEFSVFFDKMATGESQQTHPGLYMVDAFGWCEIDQCGTLATMWFDLQGAALPAFGQEVTSRACGSYLSNCCVLQFSPVTVRNCGPFFVYNLVKSSGCYYSYCVQTQD